MKSFKNFILTIILTLIMSFMILFVASKILSPKWIDHDGNMMSYIIKGFYKEEKNSLDVVFLGNSDVYRGVSPMEIYNQTGITSYNFVSAGQRMWITYPMVEEVFKYQSPKLIFLNVDSLFFTSQGNIGNYHKVYDNMPLSITKFKGVFDANYESGIDKKLSHFFPIFAYHSRYSELTKDDFKYAFADYTNPTKGLDLVAIQVPYESDKDYMEYTDKVALIPEKNLEYLNKIAELCQKNNTELILIEIPSADSWNYEKSNALTAYAKENNLKFLDLNYSEVLEEMNFNWLEDTSDGGDHLNIYGAEKVSTYIAKYLENNYELPNHKENKLSKKWNQQYEEYLNIKEKEKNLAQS